MALGKLSFDYHPRKEDLRRIVTVAKAKDELVSIDTGWPDFSMASPSTVL